MQIEQTSGLLQNIHPGIGHIKHELKAKFGAYITPPTVIQLKHCPVAEHDVHPGTVQVTQFSQIASGLSLAFSHSIHMFGFPVAHC